MRRRCDHGYGESAGGARVGAGGSRCATGGSRLCSLSDFCSGDSALLCPLFSCCRTYGTCLSSNIAALPARSTTELRLPLTLAPGGGDPGLGPLSTPFIVGIWDWLPGPSDERISLVAAGSPLAPGLALELLNRKLIVVVLLASPGILGEEGGVAGARARAAGSWNSAKATVHCVQPSEELANTCAGEVDEEEIPATANAGMLLNAGETP